MNRFTLSISFLFLLTLTFSYCTKKESTDPVPGPHINQVNFSNVTRTSFFLTASFSGMQNAEIISKGFCISKIIGLDTVSLNNASINVIANTQSFADTIKGLSYKTKYYVRAYVITPSDTIYSFVSIVATSSQALYPLGQKTGGGVVFYIDSTGEHGLIASESDIGNGSPWWPCDEGIITTESAIGTGKSNTEFIVNKLMNENPQRCFGDFPSKSVIAAKECYDLVRDGYDDWFLPSYYELDALKKFYGNRLIYPGFDIIYWSSSCKFFYPSYVIFNGGATGSFQFRFDASVRPIREF